MKDNRLRWRAFSAIVQNAFTPKKTIEVDLANLRLGQQAGVPLIHWAESHGQPQWFSCALAESPHVKLLEEWQHKAPEDQDLLDSDYFALARAVRKFAGHYRGGCSDSEILNQMRSFLADFSGDLSSCRVTKLGDSKLFEICDGHHRLAKAWVEGTRRARLSVGGRVASYWQEKLQKVNMTRRSELYQPLDLAEVQHWKLVRNCQDRLTLMQNLLQSEQIQADSLMDLGSSYGWFCRNFRDDGIGSVLAIDRDPDALYAARHLIGLAENEVHCARAEDLLTNPGNKSADVILFLSLLHHYGIGKEPGEVARLLEGLGRICNKVLFLDSGEAHEAWFRTKIPQWTPEYIRELVLKHGGFRKAIFLGKDRDAVPPNEKNYGRSLFAFLK